MLKTWLLLFIICLSQIKTLEKKKDLFDETQYKLYEIEK